MYHGFCAGSLEKLVSSPRAYAAYSAMLTKRVRMGGSSHSWSGARSLMASSSAP